MMMQTKMQLCTGITTLLLLAKLEGAGTINSENKPWLPEQTISA